MSRERWEVGWEGLWLVVEQLDGYYEASVYDPREFEVLHTATRMYLDAAKLAALEYAIVRQFGLQSDLKPQTIVDKLDWQKMG
jgi:hypothetical protein